MGVRFAQFVRFAFKTLAREPILARRLQNITGFNPIARHTTRESKLFEGNDASEVSQDDFQRSSTAFHGFHLDHRWRLDTPSLERECGPDGTRETLPMFYE